MSFKLEPGVNHCTNAQYHADETYLSSSGLKLLLKSPKQFYDEKVLKLGKPSGGAHFDIGSYVHSLILEPDRVAEEYAIYQGWQKRGKEFEAFKEQNQGKIILSQPQAFNAKNYAETTKAQKAALELLQGGQAELSIATQLLDVNVKMRADYINIDKGYMVDVKTTGHPAGLDVFKLTVKDFGYDLSAALYTLIAEQHFGREFDFYFVVISKPDLICDVYKTSARTMLEGKQKVFQALKVYKQCLSTGVWEMPEMKQDINKNYEILEV